MKNKILLILIVFLSVGIGIILVLIPFSEEKKQLTEKIKTYEAIAKNEKEKAQEAQKKQSELMIEKKKEMMKETQPGMVSFIQKTTKKPENTFEIEIIMKGDEKTVVDATDLVITYPPNVTIKEIKKGVAFPSYARLTNNNGVITITGIAMPQGTSFVYGKTNQVFATLVVQTTGKKELLEVNTKDTQAYINGTPILDFLSSFQVIEL